MTSPRRSARLSGVKKTKLKFTGGYYVLPKVVFNWNGITNNARMMFAYISDLQSNPRNETHGRVAYVGTRRLAKDLHLSKGTVQRVISYLEQEKLIIIETGPKRRWRGRPLNGYRINWDTVNAK